MKSFPKRTLLVLSLAAFPAGGSQIIHGHYIDIREAPWQLLFNLTLNNGLTGFCGAVWVGGRNVLTAAHCADVAVVATSTVQAGFTVRSEVTTPRVAIAEKIFRNRADIYGEDIAILKLAEDITAPLAKPIRFATRADSAAGLTDPGRLCVATGWGKTRSGPGGANGALGPTSDTLRSVTSDVHSHVANSIRWGGNGGTDSASSCQGDSGGPLVVRDAMGTGWILAGISSRLENFCGNPNEGPYYTRVSAFESWLLQNGVTQPSVTPVLDFRIAPRMESGFFHLTQARNMALTVSKLNGAIVLKTNRYYAAGKHALPAHGLSAGAYILRLRGADFDITRRVPAF